MIYRNKCSKEGITLIELVISIGIASIVVLVIYLFFGFGNTTYSNGTKKQQLQNDIRILSDYITNQVRYSTDVEILKMAAEPDVVAMNPNENYILIDNATKTIKHITKFRTRTFNIGDNSALTFKSTSAGKGFKFDVYAEKGNQKYNIVEEILVLNLHIGTAKVVVDNTSTTSGTITAIKYVTASNFISDQLRPIATISNNTTNSVEITFDRDILSATIISSSDIVNPSRTISTDTATINVTSANEGAKILFEIEFAGDATYGATYDYALNYIGGIWTIN